MAESDKQRDEKADKLSYRKGVEDARVRARFDDHERHLDAINGDIKDMTAAVDRVEARLATIEQRESNRDAVAAATSAAVRQHGEAQVTRRTFLLGVAGVIISMAFLFLAVSPPV